MILKNDIKYTTILVIVINKRQNIPNGEYCPDIYIRK